MLPTIASSTPTQPSAWAVLERRLIDAIDEAAPIFLEKYTRPGGALIWREDYPGDGVWADDLYEAFFNWPHYYALGGSAYTGKMAVQEWNAVTRQIEYDYGRAHREFISDDDWFHNSENYIYFYHLGMADATNAEMMRRARRFAGFYLGEDSAVPNYDRQHRLVRSPFSGSRGPLFNARRDDVTYNLIYGHTTLGPGYDYPENWHEDEAWCERVHARFNEVVMQGDVPVNLGIAPLMASAFLYTGDKKYRAWIEEYVGAWLERIAANGGILPDNVGPRGIVGEMRQGQWWGGFYGWTARYGHNMMTSALTIAAEAALLVTGEVRYLDLLRSQLDVLLERGREEEGRLVVPYKYTDAGWGDYQPMRPLAPVHLWAASMAADDWARLEMLRRGCEEEFDQVTQRGPRALDDRAWTRFLAGDFPTYPEQILQANYREVCARTAKVLADEQELKELDVHWWQQVNPVITEGLVHLTTGGPQEIYWGGLAQGRVRYFDAAGQRPGLPPDVAALVTHLGAEQVDLVLVNLNPAQPREVVVGAGSFAEHSFTTVRAGAENLPVDGGYFTVRLGPGTQIELCAGMKRYCNQPTYAFPWHEEGIPFR